MQRRLLPWLLRRRPRTLILPPFSSAQSLSSSASSSRSKKRSSSRSFSDELDDPPFSPIPKTPQSPKANSKSNSKPSLETIGSDKDATLPFHSDLHFDFRYSYSEIDPTIKPIGFREPPRFSPFGPGRLDRKWDGVCAPTGSYEAELQDKVLEVQSSVLGEPLTEVEIEELVEKYRHSDCARQINLECY